MRLTVGHGNLEIRGGNSGQAIIGAGNHNTQVVVISPPAALPPVEPARQDSRWRFTLTEEPDGTLKTKSRARLRIEPPLVQAGGRRMDFTVEVPIPTESERADLPWYCRAGARVKAPDNNRAREAEGTISRCGAAMMEAMLRDPRVFAQWSQAVNGSVQWELEGSPAFHGIPWEWMLDAARKLHPALRMHFRRRMTDVPPLEARAPQGGPLRILWVTARPGGKPARDVVLAPVRTALENAAEITVVEDGSYVGMLKHLREHEKRPRFHMVHLDMHGIVATYDQVLSRHAQNPDGWIVENRSGGRRDLPARQGTQGVLLFEESGGRADPVTAAELASALSLHRMPLVVLNACESALGTGDADEDGLSLTAELVKAGGFAALGFAQALTVDGAGLFFTSFYRSLAASPDAGHLDEAVREGRLALNDHSTRHGVPLVDWHLPVCYAAREVELPTVPPCP